MIKILLLFLTVTSLLSTSCKENKESFFYIDNASGNDKNSGLSPDDAWKSVANIKHGRVQPGTIILFKGNQVYAGSVVFDSLKGNSANPVVISSYGDGRAIIAAGDSTGFSVSNCEFIEIKKLIVKGNGRLKGNNGDGVKMLNCKHSKVDSLDVSGFMWSGLNITGGHNIDVSRVYAHDNGFCGIFAESSEKEYGEDGSKFKTLKNIHIAYSTAENNPGCPLIKDNHSGSGILIAGVVNGLIENCEAMNNGWDMPREGNGPVGIWAYMSDSIIIQYCYSHHNKTSEKGKDGGGFDFDGGITNSIMQYNLSAFNEGAGYGIFQYAGATSWNNNMMRYNISYNDGSKNGKSGIFMWYDPVALPMKNFKAFNNTIIGNVKYGVNFEPGHYESFYFENNIFFITGPSIRFIGGIFEMAKFRNNNYWSAYHKTRGIAQPEIIYDKSPLIADPKLILPASEDEFSFNTGNFSKLPYFRIKDSSPCIGRGIEITDNGNYDFWGNQVSKNIGADGHR